MEIFKLKVYILIKDQLLIIITVEVSNRKDFPKFGNINTTAPFDLEILLVSKFCVKSGAGGKRHFF